MKNWISSLLGKKLNNENLPWAASFSIYDHIVQNIDSETGKLLEKGNNLPDEERRCSGMKFRWIPGAMEGVFSHHVTSEEGSKIAKRVSGYVLEIAGKDSKKAKHDLYQILIQDEMLSFIDEALQEIISSVRWATPELHSFVVSLAKTAPDRGPVKFAIALLGIMGDAGDVDLILRLGIHEEFTLFTCVALSNMLPDPENQLWELAKKVDGWGKIHIVERLASTANSVEIKDWLLREGYRNRVMNEYLAYPCAVSGGLRDALYASEVDDDLLHAAGEIIDALLMGGPAKDIRDYADAADVVVRYLELLDDRAREVDQYLVVDGILGHLTHDWDMQARSANGWNIETRDQAIVLANRILQKPYWQEVVEKDLQSKDEGVFFLASRASDLLGIDTWNLHWARLEEKPLDGGHWYVVMKKANQQRIDQIVDYAVKVLPLEQVATGPANELGMGLQYQVHHCLDFIVQDLKYFPEKGWALIAASLKSPVVRNRNMALNALEEWGKDHWPEGAQEALIEAARLEPDEKIKVRLENMIRSL